MKNLTVLRTDRELRNNHKAAVLWFTGLSGSGKSSIAQSVQSTLFEEGRNVYVLDGDNIRQGLNEDLSFSPEDRSENIRRIAEVASLMADAGLIACCAFISPYQLDRELARDICEGKGVPFYEIFVDRSLKDCESLDPEGLYEEARSGKIKDFPGVDAPYEAPQYPDIHLDIEFYDVNECTLQVLSKLEKDLVLPFLGA